jgi:hypothetical protein
MTKFVTLLIIGFVLAGCSGGSSGGAPASGSPIPNTTQKVSRCEALQKGFQCLSKSINNFTDYAFDLMNILRVIQSDDLMSAKEDSRKVLLTFRSPIDIPKASFQDIPGEVSFVAERNAKFFFDYKSFTNLSNSNYTDKYYYSVKYPGRAFELSVINNVASITCDDGESYQIDNFKNATADCDSKTFLPYANVSTTNLGPGSCGMNFSFISPGSDLLRFQGQSFLMISRPISQSCY